MNLVAVVDQVSLLIATVRSLRVEHVVSTATIKQVTPTDGDTNSGDAKSSDANAAVCSD